MIERTGYVRILNGLGLYQHILNDFFISDFIINPFLILDSSKLKEFADDNFKFDKNGWELSKWIENNVGKGEIARYEQFLLLPHCFQMTCTVDT